LCSQWQLCLEGPDYLKLGEEERLFEFLFVMGGFGIHWIVAVFVVQQ